MHTVNTKIIQKDDGAPVVIQDCVVEVDEDGAEAHEFRVKRGAHTIGVKSTMKEAKELANAL